MVTLDNVQQAFLTLLTPNLAQLPPILASQWRILFDLADEHHVTPYLYKQLKPFQTCLPAKIIQRGQLAYRLNCGRNLAHSQAFVQLSQALAAKHIPIVPLKGLFLINEVYGSIGERVLGDLDLWVPSEHLREAVAVSQALGYVPDRPVVFEQWLGHKHQLPAHTNGRSGIVLEWHAHLFKTERAIPVAELWQWIEGGTAPIELHLIHLAYHMAYHHHFLFGLRNLVDIAIVCHQKAAHIDWHWLIAHTNNWRLTRGVCLALWLAHQHLMAPVPEMIWRQLEQTAVSESHIALATQQLFVPPAVMLRVPQLQRKISNSTSLFEKVRFLRRALFPSPAFMATRYGIEPGAQSTWVRWHYRWRRLAAFAWKNRQQAWGQTAVSSMLKRRRELNRWLEGE